MNQCIDWDVKTVTAGDYTIEFVIDRDMYKRFLEQYYNEANPLPEIAQFRTFVKDELETRLTSMPSAGMDDSDQIKIAMITFAFDNAKVINWLRHRGTCIKKEDWKGLKDTNETIQNALKTD